MPKEAAGPKNRRKKALKTTGGRKKATDPKAVVARGKIKKSDPVRILNAIGLKSQHLDFLTLRIDQVKKF